MGCDIHCYVEYREADREDGDEWAASWRSFGGRINPGRDYDAFASIAGVRDYDGAAPIVKPRGFPKDAGYQAMADNTLYVVDEGEGDGEGECTRAQAERWGGNYVGGDRRQCQHPDWHSHTWLTPDEWAAATETGGTGRSVRRAEYKAMTAAMRSLEKSGKEVRVVIWFDN